MPSIKRHAIHPCLRTEDKFCGQGWNGQCVIVSLAILEKPGVLKTIEGPTRSHGSMGTKISTNLGYHCPQGGPVARHPIPAQYVMTDSGGNRC